MTSKLGHLQGVVGVRIARDCPELAPAATFYRELGLVEQTSFSDHEGYDGVIFRLADGPRGWLQWELTQGPEQHASPSHGGWELAGVAVTGRDPAGFRAEWPQQGLLRLRRRSRYPAECSDFYGSVLGLPVTRDRDIVRITLPQCHLELDPVDEADFTAPSVEDLLVFYFDDPAKRDAAAGLVATAGAPAGRPDNPWWHRRAQCFFDPDGYLVALTCLD
ncbi:MAG TPA: VOC family protein [Jatrophihabitans sp.]|nr:VOC family protein [Jatrophihabitans sp.]